LRHAAKAARSIQASHDVQLQLHSSHRDDIFHWV
jgi:hypothetical protein